MKHKDFIEGKEYGSIKYKSWSRGHNWYSKIVCKMNEEMIKNKCTVSSQKWHSWKRSFFSAQEGGTYSEALEIRDWVIEISEESCCSWRFRYGNGNHPWKGTGTKKCGMAEIKCSLCNVWLGCCFLLSLCLSGCVTLIENNCNIVEAVLGMKSRTEFTFFIYYLLAMWSLANYLTSKMLSF